MSKTARLLVAVLSVPVLTLGLFEVGARLFFGQARDVLAIYEADARWGVRLRPGTEAALKSRTGRVSQIQIGADGFRAGRSCDDAAWHNSQASRVLLLGDSQVFGYHVEGEQTLAAQLQSALGPRHQVKSLAVPTHGPYEYTDVLRQSLDRCRPDAVWWVLNEANDHQEATTRNAQRVTAEAGYARRTVAKEYTGLRAFLVEASAHSAAAFHIWRGLSVARSLVTGASAHGLSHVASRPDDEVVKSTDALIAHIETARALCAEAGCTLHVAVLPPDVLVSPAEADKYRESPQLNGFSRYRTRLLKRLSPRGITVDLLPTLQKHSPGLFWHDDPHLSPAGQRAVAGAMARAMSRVTPPKNLDDKPGRLAQRGRP